MRVAAVKDESVVTMVKVVTVVHTRLSTSDICLRIEEDEIA